MKKLIVILALAMMSTNATAAVVTATGATAKGFNPTKNVSVIYDVLTVNGVNTAYGNASQHLQGDKVFASSSAFGGIMYMTTTPGSMISAPPYVPTTPTDSTMTGASGWTLM